MIGAGVSPGSVSLSRRLAVPRDPVWVVVGDSTTVENSQNWVGLLRAANPGVEIHVVAGSGRVVGNISDPEGTNSLNGHFEEMMAFNPTRIIGSNGANDFPQEGAPTSTDAFRDMQEAFWARIRARDPSCKIVWATVFARGDLGIGYATFNDYRRNIGNPRIIAAAAEGKIDAVMDFGGDPIGGTDESMFIGGDNGDRNQHPGPFQHARYGAIANAVMQSDLAGATGTQCSPFVLPDYIDAAKNTRYVSRFIIRGLGMGQTANFTVSGGDIAVQLGAAGTSAVTGRNGDTITVGRNSSGADDTLVSATATSGTESESMTIRTAAAPPADPANVVAGDPFVSDDLAAEGYPSVLTKTLAFPAGVRGIAVHAHQAATGVTIGGQTATKRASVDASQSKSASIWDTAAPVAAGSHAVVITFAAAIGNVNLQTFSAQNVGGGVSTAQIKQVGEAPGATTPATDVVLGTGGAAVCFAFGRYANNFTWTGATEIGDAKYTNTSETFAGSLAKQTATGKPVATPDAGFGALLIVPYVNG